MTMEIPRPVLKDVKALVVGIANDSSIAWGCAKAFRELGADLAITYLNDKARPHVEPLARSLDASIFLPLDVAVPGQLEAVFDAVTKAWGRLDILVHSIAFANPAALQLMRPPCRSSFGAKAIECTRMSSLPHALVTASKTASS